ncbi:nucleotidyltransferase domain-containing protein [Candidatus Poribacteria bacterium]|nr:nucleotidyltransferase domain-containing protein [Candidatus Poribacteria bacterium]
MDKVSGKISDILEILKGLKDVIRKEYNAEMIGVFGSYARGEEKRNSDIDILVRFFEDRTAGRLFK